ncbi:papain family cysteine protease [Ancylostoma ceylanicum]|uniref:Papain family cysteine protease n=1 Tax=Ancylostoma ceylanicum TaxID=53326 RepID=A0A0D6LKM6_9BILA|nr:papain family cysteine protease [Ancylostoma ceylanicum]
MVGEEFLDQPMPEYAQKLTGQALVDYINEHQSLYKAEYSPEAEAFTKARIMDLSFLESPEEKESSPNVDHGETLLDHDEDIELPDSFDARQHWPECKSIGIIRDQSKCDAREVTRSRHTAGWSEKGSALADDIGRRMLTMNLAKKSYFLPNNETLIRREIFKNGPVVAGFRVYIDFSFYRGGIYKNNGGIPLGAHAVKVIGWGREKNANYWLIANSWNSDWGENGYFRMARGINNCGIEERMVGGLMKIE